MHKTITTNNHQKTLSLLLLRVKYNTIRIVLSVLRIVLLMLYCHWCVYSIESSIFDVIASIARPLSSTPPEWVAIGALQRTRVKSWRILQSSWLVLHKNLKVNYIHTSMNPEDRWTRRSFPRLAP